MIKENKNILSHWQLKKLGDVFHTTSGGTPSRKNAGFYKGNIPWVKSGELDKGIILDTEEKLSEEAIKSSSAKIFPKGTLLIALYGATIGKLAFLGIDASTNQAICGIFESEEVRLKYLYYFLFFKKAKLVEQGIGGAQPNISQTILKNLNVPFPDPNEQDLIVSKIEELFSELDKGLEQLKTAQQQLKIYRQSLLKAAFEGRLTHKIVREGELPKGWKWTSFDQVCSKIGDIDHKMPKQIITGYPYVSTKDFTDDLKISFDNAKYISEDDFLNLSRKIKPEKDDIIFPRYGTIGKNILIDFDKEFLVSYSCAIIKPDKDLVLPKYLYLYSLSPKINQEIKKYVVETTQANIGIASIKRFVFPLPSIEEQKAVVEVLEHNLAVYDKIQDSINKGLMQAESLRQSILKQAFEGKLVTIQQQKQEAQVVSLYKPENEYFYQLQVLGLIAKASKQNKVPHGEMTLAKYAYLTDKLFDVPTFYNYQRWHLGPFPPTIKKVFNNRQYFKKVSGEMEVLNEKKLFKSVNPYQQQIERAVAELTGIFFKYEGKERSHKTELLATVCKVLEDIQTVDLKAVRSSMADWKIELKGEKHKTKAEKFTEAETKKCLAFLKEKRWDKKLIK